MKCDICQKEGLYKTVLMPKAKPLDVAVFACGDCYSRPQGSIFHISKTVLLNGEYKTTQARIDELNRRVVLNYDKKTGTYDVGRRMENGKIAEKQPNYYK